MFSKPFCFFTVLALFLYAIVLFFYYDATQKSAIVQAKQQTKDFLRIHHATEVFLKKEAKIDKGIYLSSLNSCTFASKKINTYYNMLRQKDDLPEVTLAYIAKNPREATNIASKKELDLLNSFNTQDFNEYTEVIQKNDKKYLYYAEPINHTQKSCLKCHGDPTDAPQKLLEKYGNEKGFYYEEGKINAFKKVLMPLDKFFHDSLKLFLIISTSVLLFLIGIFVAIRIFIFRNEKEKKKFQSLIDSLDEIIIAKEGDSIYSVNKAFLNFFKVKNIKEFAKRYQCISNLFDKNPNSLEIDFHAPAEELIEKINTTEASKRLVYITDENKKCHTFKLHIERLGEKSKKDTFVIVLSDVTLLQGKADALAQKANIDPLTQVYSRGRFDDLYEEEFWRSLRYFNNLSILFIDIDYFKSINDTYGHDIGDKTLKEFAQIIQKNIRKFDILARWGGEEFILMLPQTDIKAGYKLAEKLRLLVKEHKFEKIDNLTFSIGISMLKKADETTTLIKRADIALYKAKSSGRDKIIIEI